jgi:aspartate aminotransferase
LEALSKNFTKYTPAGGTQELKQAVCERHKADYGTNYTPAERVITVGGKHAIFGIMQAVINAGDEVIIPVPYWVTYKTSSTTRAAPASSSKPTKRMASTSRPA